jgi:hypothetical protein
LVKTKVRVGLTAKLVSRVDVNPERKQRGDILPVDRQWLNANQSQQNQQRKEKRQQNE